MSFTPYANKFPGRGPDAPNEVHWLPYEFGNYVYRANCPSANLSFKVTRAANKRWTASVHGPTNAMVLSTGCICARDAMNAVENFADNLPR